MMMKAFISHSSIDKPFVERLATDLRTREGIDAWLDKWEILPGERIPQKLEEGLSNADIFVLVLSPESVNSQWVSYEKDAWLTAQVNEEVRARQESRTPSRRLIPVLYKDCEKPFFLKSFLHVSINDQNYEEGFQQLVRGMRGESGKPPRKGEMTPAPIPLSTTGQVSSGVAPRILAFTLLKSLLPAQFSEVIFYYDVEESQLPTNVAQVQKAIDVIKFARQKEGESLSGLLDSIYQAAPHLKR
ncbi:MAG: toll/interleukin-1 receptor domain-containing protein [Cyanobacteriota bacterium]